MKWEDADGNPLRFPYGQAVKINWGSGAPFIRDRINSGWIIGFDCASGAEPAYRVHRMGRTLTIREAGLSPCNDGEVPFSHTKHVMAGPTPTCSICGLNPAWLGRGPCNCEHTSHFPEDGGSGHPYMQATAGQHEARHVGAVCDDCARTCMAGHLAD